MQAIVVKFIGPTNTKPSRWKVGCAAMTITVTKGTRDNNDDKDARMAAEHLRDLLGWTNDKGRYGEMIEGFLPNGDRVFVFTG